MTLHWWMHWFWITSVVATLALLANSAPVFEAAPEFSQVPSQFSRGVTLPSLVLSSSSVPEHSDDDSSLYVALVHDIPSSATSFPDGSHFPLHALQTFHDLSQVPFMEHEVTYPPHYDNSESNETFDSIPQDNPTASEAAPLGQEGEQSKLFPRGIAEPVRLGKAINHDYSPSTPPLVEPSSSKTSNRNPFLAAPVNEEKVAVPEISVTQLPYSAISSKQEVGDEDTPVDQEVVVTSVSSLPVDASIIPYVTTEDAIQVSTGKTIPDTISVVETTSVMPPKLNPPDWVPSFSSEEDSAEDTDKNIQLNSSTEVYEQPNELESTEGSSEAVTKGRMTAERGLDGPSIAGIVLGLVGLAAIAGGAIGWVFYRHRYVNKPQTLNDKSSNADSSGYIDDTLRDNSEEMYSLDNDSFLNSLEAMTIQNYWTDSVKHTKL